ncbi:MAG: sulfur carrier protein ThiS [Hyphomicrobium sp.]|nr:sulfur carrier protein ThiS [Hyphomicrobium sp.]
MHQPSLRITINGAVTIAAGGTLAELVDHLGYGEQRIATALNGEFVPQSRRATTAIADGDRVEILAARQGG